MTSDIVIPKRINVGFQERKDTYTKMLAYVIYWDEKGKLRKEKSWDSWRDHDIETQSFDNEPTSGFVLNKKVGDYDNGWNHRKAYCRVYDPRGFEFEIGFENLLYILENANSIKGKGLEGEFVYGWSGTDLVLIPTESIDYKHLVEYNSLLQKRKNIKIKDLIVGATYLTKNNTKAVYMGKFPYYEKCISFLNMHTGESGYTTYVYEVQRLIQANKQRLKYESSGTYIEDRHYFAILNSDNSPYNKEKNNYFCTDDEFFTLKTMQGKIIGCLDESKSAFFDELLKKMQLCRSISPVDMSKSEVVQYSLEQFMNIMDDENRWHTYIYSDTGSPVEILRSYQTKEDVEKVGRLYKVIELSTYYADSKYTEESVITNLIKDRFETETTHERRYIDGNEYEIVENIKMIPTNIQDIYERLKPSYKNIYLTNGLLCASDHYLKAKKGEL